MTSLLLVEVEGIFYFWFKIYYIIYFFSTRLK